MNLDEKEWRFKGNKKNGSISLDFQPKRNSSIVHLLETFTGGSIAEKRENAKLVLEKSKFICLWPADFHCKSCVKAAIKSSTLKWCNQQFQIKYRG